MTRFTEVLFDFDGTIADTAQCGINATQEAFSKHGLSIPDEVAIVSRMGIPIEASFPQICDHPLNLDQHRELILTFRSIYRELAPHCIQIFSGMKELLTGIKSNGGIIAVVTSKKTDVARRNMETIGVSDLIDHVIGADMVTRFKPHPESVEVALRTLGLTPSPSVIVVGDSTYDIYMGRSAGVHTCAVTWGAHSRKELQFATPDFVVDSVSELRALLLDDGALH